MTAIPFCYGPHTQPPPEVDRYARAGSLAWAGLANSYYWIDSAKGVAGVYATQILPFFDEKAVQAFRAFETAVYRAI